MQEEKRWVETQQKQIWEHNIKNTRILRVIKYAIPLQILEQKPFRNTGKQCNTRQTKQCDRQKNEEKKKVNH